MSGSICQWADCGTAFESVELLVAHFIDDHINVIKEPFYCRWKDCPRTGDNFCSKSALNTHVRIHTGERPYKCNQCQKSFSRSDAMKKHMRNVHDMRRVDPEQKVIKNGNVKKLHSALLDIKKSLILQLDSNKEDIRKLRCSKSVLLELILLKNS